jgi:hypothetical protein
VQAHRNGEMVRSKSLFQDVDATATELLGFPISTFVLVKRSEISKASGDSGMMWSELSFQHGQAAPVERLGIGILAFVLVF